MITFTIASFIITMFIVILAGAIFGAWLLFTEEERDKKSKEKKKNKNKK